MVKQVVQVAGCFFAVLGAVALVVFAMANETVGIVLTVGVAGCLVLFLVGLLTFLLWSFLFDR